MNESERAKLREHEVTRSPAWDYDRTHPTFMSLYSRNEVHFLGEAPILLGCFFVREGSQVPLFWSRDGHAPRVRSFRYEFGASAAGGPVALAGRWRVASASGEGGGSAISGGDVQGEGLLDLYIETSSDLALHACALKSDATDIALEEPTEEDLVVNETVNVATDEVEASAACAGTPLQWRVPKDALEKRKGGTRLRFAAGLSLRWIEGTLVD